MNAQKTGPDVSGSADTAAQAKRFLLLFSDTGGGHRASAQAVGDELLCLHGQAAAVELLDVFIELGQWPWHRFPTWYPSCLAFNGIPWGIGFHLSNHVKLMQTASTILWPYVGAALRNLLDRHPAEVIVSFHPIPNCALLMGLRAMNRSTPIAIVALDMVTLHAGWLVPGAALYTVPTLAAKANALRAGVPEDRVSLTGIPIRQRFLTAMQLPTARARAQLRLSYDKPIVLVVGGGDGIGPLEQIVRAIAHMHPAALVVVITGHNHGLKQVLTRMDLPIPVRIEGFVSNMEVWMRAADVLVTKAGPNTLAEAFAMGLPLVIYTALPGQEQENVNHVVENGAGLWAPLPQQTAEAVVQLLSNGEMRETMATRARALARPQATRQIAQNLWRLTSEQLVPRADIPLRKRPLEKRGLKTSRSGERRPALVHNEPVGLAIRDERL